MSLTLGILNRVPVTLVLAVQVVVNFVSLTSTILVVLAVLGSISGPFAVNRVYRVV